MAYINESSLNKKLSAYFSSSKGKQKVTKVVDDIMLGRVSFKAKNAVSANKAADIFVTILRDTILSAQGSDFASGELGNSAVSSLLNIKHSLPKRTGISRENIYYYSVDISFMGDKHRDSLEPDRFGGIDNIVALLNAGYKDKGSRRTNANVSGEWHGKQITGLRRRSGANFLEDAVRRYTDEYAVKHGVVGVRIDDVYDIDDYNNLTI